MRRPSLSRRACLAAALPWLPFGRAAGATGEFPDRTVRIVVPYSVGIGPDVVARSVAQQLARRWGQAVVVDNKPGGSGITAFGEVRHTAADGHTLFLADTATLSVNPLRHARLPYDPQRDLLPLSLLFRVTFVLWVGGVSRFDRLASLLEAARRASGAVSYASLGHGHASHVAVETLARAAGVTLLHVPFKGAGAMLAAVATAEVDFTVVGVHTAAALMAQGRLRPLAVAAPTRLVNQPAIRTRAEARGPAVTMQPWAALVTVAGTPAGLVDRLRRDIAAVLGAEEVLSQATRAGFEITPSTPRGGARTGRGRHRAVRPAGGRSTRGTFLRSASGSRRSSHGAGQYRSPRQHRHHHAGPPAAPQHAEPADGRGHRCRAGRFRRPPCARRDPARGRRCQRLVGRA
jgi:tripartite-type tricarboxylate transporter receptor subunit TctC